MFSLRDYQEEAVKAITQMEKGEIGLVALPTGSGKTIIMSELARQTNGRVLIVVSSTELREQTIDKLKKFVSDDVTIGSVQGRLNETNADVCVSTRQSLTHKKSTRLEDLKSNGNFDLIVFDECHQAVNQLKKIVDNLDITNSRVIGLTATPYNKEMIKIFNSITYKKSLLWMIDSNYLVQPRAYEIETTTDISKVKSVAGEFNQKDLENTINNEERNYLIVDAYKKYATDRKHTICFCSGIDHCKDLTEEFVKQGIKCKSVDSNLDMTEREEILKEFKSGEIDVLCNIGILTTGFDFPETDCIMFARPTKSKILYTQMLGRGLRLAKNKEDCLILDFKDVITKHNIMEMEDIFGVNFKDGETLKQAKERKEKEDIEEQLEQERLRKEEIRRQEELIAKEIDLLNSNLDSTFSDTYYDWFKISNDMYALSQECDLHYVIHRQNKEFTCYKVFTKKNETNCEELECFENVTEAINYIENSKLENAFGGYAYRNTHWKSDEATENQLKYVKSYYAHKVRTKWDVHRYFKAWLIQKLVENN